MTAMVPGLMGINLFGVGTALHLLVSVLLGAGFGAMLRYQPQSHAAILSIGSLYGLLLWIAGPLTLGDLLDGGGPTWSLNEAGVAFPSLIGHMLYGGITGLGFYILVALYLRLFHQFEPLGVQDEAPKQRVVILGGGFGGISVAQRLEQLFSRDPSLEITLVSQSNYLLYTPMLAEVASSGLEPQHISAPIRASCPNTQFHRTDVAAVDTSARIVWVSPGESIPAEAISYDHLVLALGSVPNFFGLPGLEEYSFTMKSLEDATRLRNQIIALLEHADVEPNEEERRRQLTFVVAGGGFAGAETIAELFDLARAVLRYYPNIQPKELRFLLIHPQDRILPELSAELGDYARRKLQARGIEFLLNTRVAGAAPDAVLLNDGSSVATRTLVWTAGNQPNPILKTLPCQRNGAGAVVVNSALQVEGLPNVWAVGDCAQIPDHNHEGQSHPPTAQHALREGKTVAENIAATIRGKPIKQFRFRTIGVLVGLGHRTAAAEIRGWRFSGLLAWFMWRTLYLSKLPGMEKKVRVALDWTIDLFFPRDIVLTSTADRSILPQSTETVQAPGLSQERPQPDVVKELV